MIHISKKKPLKKITDFACPEIVILLDLKLNFQIFDQNMTILTWICILNSHLHTYVSFQKECWILKSDQIFQKTIIDDQQNINL